MSAVTIRYADSLDETPLAALAALDSAALPAPPMLVAEVEGELLVALSLTDARTIADPFRPTAALAELLRTRAQQLADTPRAGPLARLRGPWRAPAHSLLGLRG